MSIFAMFYMQCFIQYLIFYWLICHSKFLAFCAMYWMENWKLKHSIFHASCYLGVYMHYVIGQAIASGPIVGGRGYMYYMRYRDALLEYMRFV